MTRYYRSMERHEEQGFFFFRYHDFVSMLIKTLMVWIAE